MQLGIRLHDVNAGLGPEYQTIEARAEKARVEVAAREFLQRKYEEI